MKNEIVNDQPLPCEKCLKMTELCICDQLKKLPSKRHVIILQHPQEPDKELGTAQIASLCLKNSTLKIGLSWRSLKAVIGKENIDPKKWGVLYLGSGIKTKTYSRILFPVDKKGESYPEPLIDETLKKLEGIILIDGTWSQAKTLWWRNAWLLKCQRLILQNKKPSLYGKLRKEPKRECLSTLESIAETFDALKEDPKIGEALRENFKALLEKYKALKSEEKKA